MDIDSIGSCKIKCLQDFLLLFYFLVKANYPHIPALATSLTHHRSVRLEVFLAKGRFRGFLEKVPVKVILDETAALLGAARFAVEAARRP